MLLLLVSLGLYSNSTEQNLEKDLNRSTLRARQITLKIQGNKSLLERDFKLLKEAGRVLDSLTIAMAEILKAQLPIPLQGARRVFTNLQNIIDPSPFKNCKKIPCK